ncbi:MAG: chemotaxis protein CheC [Bacteroidales bacterium]|nr:chemotaxis protein CheC [Bacteroidales bacterium]
MLNALQIEILKEIINIGVGKSAEVLNSMIQSHILLDVPEVKIVEYSEYDKFVHTFEDTDYSVITLPFNGELNGFSKLIMSSDHAAKLVDAFIGKSGASLDMDSLKIDILSEIGNVIINAVMGTLGNMLTINLDYIVPSYEKGVRNIIIPQEMLNNKSAILFAKTQFKIEEFEAEGNFAIFFRLESFKSLVEKIQEYFDKNIS